MNINELLSQARSLRVEAHHLIRDVASGSEKRAASAQSDSGSLDHVVRTGTDPAELEAFLKTREARYEAAKNSEVALETMAKRFGDMFAQLQAAVDPKSADGDQGLLSGEINLCIGTMAELAEAVKTAVFETSVAAALAGKTTSGLILVGAQAAKPHIIRPEGFEIKRAS